MTCLLPANGLNPEIIKTDEIVGFANAPNSNFRRATSHFNLEGSTKTPTDPDDVWPDVEHPGITGLPPGCVEALSYTVPEYMYQLSAQLAVLSSTMSSTGYIPLTDKVSHMLADAQSSFNNRRLPQKVKDNVLDWVFDLCETRGRNRHERAALVPKILGGANSIMQPKEYVCNPGTLGSAIELIVHALSASSSNGYVEYGIRNELVTKAHDVLLGCGVSRQHFDDYHRMQFIQLLASSEQHAHNTSAALNDLLVLHTCIGPFNVHTLNADLGRINLVWPNNNDTDGLILRRLINKVSNLSHVLNTSANWMNAINGITSKTTEGEMETFIDELLKRYTRKLKTRGAAV